MKKMITVRVYPAFAAALKAEAHIRRVSMNQLCIEQLRKCLSKEAVVEGGGDAGMLKRAK